MSEAKDFFQSLIDIEDQIKTQLDTLARLNALAEKMTSVLRDVPVSGSGNDRKLENSIIRQQDIANSIEEKKAELDKRREYALQIINALPTEKHRRILTKKYFNGESFNTIAEEMNYSRSGINKLHGRALYEAGKIMEKAKKCIEVDIQSG